MAGLAVICAPLFMSQELPLNVWYPFSTKPLLRKFILYFMHICAIEHVVFCLGMDVMIAIFFFYLAARMEILAFEIEQATDEAHVISSIQKHQEIIE
ncbi:odorant receptor or2-like protein [Lasius niger]|uniref:Odorant receptor or2-like protein n=2 Tax=Lasius TaxID=488720 RepID=A0A0J7N556_LASNI|nr:odorant receptor or2-like protein [Lasius niger]